MFVHSLPQKLPLDKHCFLCLLRVETDLAGTNPRKSPPHPVALLRTLEISAALIGADVSVCPKSANYRSTHRAEPVSPAASAAYALRLRILYPSFTNCSPQRAEKTVSLDHQITASRKASRRANSRSEHPPTLPISSFSFLFSFISLAKSSRLMSAAFCLFIHLCSMVVSGLTARNPLRPQPSAICPFQFVLDLFCALDLVV